MWRLLFILSLCPFLGCGSADVIDCECPNAASPSTLCLLEEEIRLKLEEGANNLNVWQTLLASRLEEISTRLRQQTEDLNNIKSMVKLNSDANGTNNAGILYEQLAPTSLFEPTLYAIQVDPFTKKPFLVEILRRPKREKLSSSKPKYPNSCDDISIRQSEIVMIQVPTVPPQQFKVYCNMDEHGGKWAVIQRRVDDSVDFNLDWASYKAGFGDLKGNFFIGLEKLHALTETIPQELLIVLTDFNNVTKYAKYDSFAIGDESESYAMNVLGTYSGNAGDSLSYHQGMKFSTKDKENDLHAVDNCAEKYKGAWWYNWCIHSNLNGVYLNGETSRFGEGVCWVDFRGLYYSLKTVQMMIRPKLN